MNIRANQGGGDFDTEKQQRKRVFQRRLHERLCESRMLEVLDHKLQRTGHASDSNNQEHEEQDLDQQHENEEELVCVSTMIKLANTDSALLKSSEYQTGGVLKTVRSIHRLRATGSGCHENQTGH